MIPVAATIGQGDILGPLLTSNSDRFGLETARYAALAGRQFALAGGAHKEFMAFTAALHKQSAVRDAVSLLTVRNISFEWLYTTRMNGPGRSYSDFVLERFDSLVQERTVIVPVFGLFVEEPFEIGHVLFANIEDSEIRVWRASVEGQLKDVDKVNEFFAILEKRVGGCAAARMTIRAESEYAWDRVLEEAGS